MEDDVRATIFGQRFYSLNKFQVVFEALMEKYSNKFVIATSVKDNAGSTCPSRLRYVCHHGRKR